jgi:putative phosphoesterase
MRILLISDIHANWPALAAVAAANPTFDACWCLGDLVDYGLQPGPVVEWVRTHAQYSVRGNHDHGAVQNVVIAGVSGFKYLTGITRPLTINLLTPSERRYLADLPVTQSFTLAGKRFLLCHATPRDPLEEHGPKDAEFWASRLEGVEADVVCVGHTHQQFCLQVGKTLVINPGSVGLPRDGDTRAGYGVYADGEVSFHRIDYPIDAACATVRETPMPDLARELLLHVYQNGKLPK